MINVLEIIGDKYKGTISPGIHNNWAKFNIIKNAQKAKQEIDDSGCYITGDIENRNSKYGFTYVMKQKSLLN